MPYHALTHAERETYNARRKLLAHIGDILRTKAVDRERRRLEDEISLGKRSKLCVNCSIWVFLDEIPGTCRWYLSRRNLGGFWDCPV